MATLFPNGREGVRCSIKETVLTSHYHINNRNKRKLVAEKKNRPETPVL